MKLSPEFQTLDQARQRMGAPLSSWKSGTAPERTWESFTVEITLDELESLGPGGLLIRRSPDFPEGQQALLYIKDTRRDRQTLLYDPERSPRFHIAECATLKRMRRENRFDRYVQANRTDGVFDVESTDPDTGKVEAIKDVELHVCKNCLDTLDLRKERANWPEFSVPDFFRDNETFFSSLPRHTDKTAPPSGYPKNWDRISRLYKERQRWICEECRVNLTHKQSLMHCHHRNGVTSDNGPENLQALCAECHSKQPGHGRYPPDAEERAMLTRLRAEQKNPRA